MKHSAKKPKAPAPSRAVVHRAPKHPAPVKPVDALKPAAAAEPVVEIPAEPVAAPPPEPAKPAGDLFKFRFKVEHELDGVTYHPGDIKEFTHEVAAGLESHRVGERI